MKRTLASVFILGFVLAIGCGPKGPELGEVEGIITLDGEPVPDAVITYVPMFPDGVECKSSDKTDANGYYRIRYNRERYGVKLGEYMVQASTRDEVRQLDGSKKFIREVIPKVYWSIESPVIVNVEAGKNDLNLEMFTDPDDR